jgi:hypothetical protein
VFTVDESNIKKLMSMYSNENLVVIIRKLEENAGNIEEFTTIIKNTPLHIQTMFVEYAFIAERRNIGVNVDLRRNILEIYKDYLKTVKGITMLVLDEKHFKCFKKDEWVTCPPDLVEAYVSGMQDRVKILESNKYGYYGIYNKSNKKFFIRDVSSSDLITGEGKGEKKEDKRKKTKGRECPAGLNKTHLTNVCLAIDLPWEKSAMDKKTLISKIDPANVDTKKVDLNALSRDQLDMIYYWTSQKKPAICTAVREWMEANDLILVE